MIIRIHYGDNTECDLLNDGVRVGSNFCTTKCKQYAGHGRSAGPYVECERHTKVGCAWAEKCSAECFSEPNPNHSKCHIFQAFNAVSQFSKCQEAINRGSAIVTQYESPEDPGTNGGRFDTLPELVEFCNRKKIGAELRSLIGDNFSGGSFPRKSVLIKFIINNAVEIFDILGHDDNAKT